MQKINVNLYPSGGRYFTESDGSVHRASSWNLVIKKVTEYRERKRVPVGDVAVEVVAQACQRNPALCYDDKRAKGQPIAKPPQSLKARVLIWLNGFVAMLERGVPLQYVDANEARQRANVCAKCPLNTPLGTSECATCKQALAGYRDRLIGRGRAQDGRLGGCSALGADLITAIHLDELRIENASLPNHCWRKRSI